MSIEATVARVSEIEQMMSASSTGGTQAPPPQGFKAQLDQASAAMPATASSAAPAPAPAGGNLGSGSPSQFDGAIQAAASRNGIDPALLKGLIRAESNFNPRAGSPAGAQGLTQLMPGTARTLGVSDPYDPVQSIEGGAKYLREQLQQFGGDVQKALAAYNAGPGAVQKFGGVPPYPETQAYVKRVLQYAEGYR
jgi:soluble lytic murein transglycosylase-like protein